MKINPFGDGDVHSLFEHHLGQILAEIDALENEYVLKASPSELDEHFIEKAIVVPLTLDAAEHYIEDQQSFQMDVSHDFRRAVFPGERAEVPATQLKIAIPFEGDPQLWRIRPSSYSLGGYPEITVHSDRIVFTMSFPDDSPEQQRLKNEIDRQIKALAGAVDNQRRDVDRHNENAPKRITEKLKAKRAKSSTAVGVVAGLGIPIKRRQSPSTYIAPVSRRPSPSKRRPKVTTEAYKPEPVLESKEYEHILSILESMSRVVERNPNSFSALNEEAIRDHFLLQLNGHYEGAATGETFNSSGKTDILIRVEDRNIFIAECKFWKGPKGFSDTIDQLLGYLTWRDCKCALMIFNRNQDSTSVINKMHEVMEQRTEWVRTLTRDPEGTSRYVFVRQSDPGKEIVISTMLFDIPST